MLYEKATSKAGRLADSLASRYSESPLASHLAGHAHAEGEDAVHACHTYYAPRRSGQIAWRSPVPSPPCTWPCSSLGGWRMSAGAPSPSRIPQTRCYTQLLWHGRRLEDHPTPASQQRCGLPLPSSGSGVSLPKFRPYLRQPGQSSARSTSA